MLQINEIEPARAGDLVRYRKERHGFINEQITREKFVLARIVIILLALAIAAMALYQLIQIISQS